MQKRSKEKSPYLSAQRRYDEGYDEDETCLYQRNFRRPEAKYSISKRGLRRCTSIFRNTARDLIRKCPSTSVLNGNSSFSLGARYSTSSSRSSLTESYTNFRIAREYGSDGRRSFNGACNQKLVSLNPHNAVHRELLRPFIFLMYSR